MYCKNCGRELQGERFCPSCGTATDLNLSHRGTSIQSIQENGEIRSNFQHLAEDLQMVCYSCGSRNFQLTTEIKTTTTGKNYSGTKGCLGYLLLGPLGLLCGSCGQGQQTNSTTSTHWICSNCGKKHINPDKLKQEIKQGKVGMGIAVFSIILLLILIMMGINSDYIESYIVVFLVIYLIFMLLVGAAVSSVIKSKEALLNEVEEGMQKYNP